MSMRSFLASILWIVFLLTACQPAAVEVVLTAEPGGVLLSDTFTDPAGGWTRAASPVGAMDYFSGSFRITVAASDYDLWSLSGHLFRDVQVAADAGRLGGPLENRFGLVCRYRDPSNFYFFVISSDGYYAVGKVSAGARSLIGQEMMLYSPAIITGIAPNHLRFDCIGTVLIGYVNGQPIAVVQDGDHPEGDVGLLAGTFDMPGTDIIFDNLRVTNP
ncbi:MAG: hypothetical protein JXB85_17500 [Anaerolineales bacterium]|nr:hypothetical protein [Anaerolineales bacterium]